MFRLPAFPVPKKVVVEISAPSTTDSLFVVKLRFPPFPSPSVVTDKPEAVKAISENPRSSISLASIFRSPAFPVPKVVVEISAPSATNNESVTIVKFPPSPVSPISA